MSEQITQLIEALKGTAEEIGLYAREIHVGAVTPEDAEEATFDGPMDEEKVVAAIKDGKEYTITAIFTVGDLAWSDRIQNPEEYEIKKEFRQITPGLSADMKQRILDKIERGESLLDDDEEDTE